MDDYLNSFWVEVLISKDISQCHRKIHQKYDIKEIVYSSRTIDKCLFISYSSIFFFMVNRFSPSSR